MFNGLPLAPLIGIFLVAAGVVWFAGIRVSDATDVLSARLGLGEAMGGLIVLAFVTNLPELAITVSAALGHHIGIAIGNILGGIAIQTVVLVVLDGLGVRDVPLSYKAASLVLVLEGALVIGILSLVIMSTQLPSHLIFLRLTPGSVMIALLWLLGLFLLSRARTDLPWQQQGRAPDAQQDAQVARRKANEKASEAKRGTMQVVMVLAIAAFATLAAGVALEESGNGIASHIGLTGVVFGSTFLAAATSLPEVSTGLTAVKLGDYQLAFSDIFGGNAFLPVLFLLATLLSGTAVLPEAQSTDIYLTSLGILLTMVYLWGLIFRPRRQFLRLGIDSIVVLVVYIVGVLGLVAIARG